jgi:FkbM family methyltransferase
MTTIRMRLSVVPGLRQLVLRALRAVGDRDVAFRHPVTRDALTVHLFRHRGYWFHRARREQAETEIVATVLRGAEGTLVDVGANIGFLSLVYRQLAPEADVIAVEPSPMQLRYLRANVEGHNVTVAGVALGAVPGSAILFEDSLTGQNSSLVDGFKVLAMNAKRAGVRASTAEVAVPVTTLDALLIDCQQPVAFIKIDVEGFECEVLAGAAVTLAQEHPILQVEVQRRITDTLQTLRSLGYRILAADPLDRLLAEDHPSVTFAVHTSDARAESLMKVASRFGYADLMSDA